jgi:hypothetical protein
MTPTPPPGPGDNDHDRLVALGRDVDRTTRRVGELEVLLRQLAADVTALARQLGAPSPGPGDTGAVRAWLLAEDPRQAAADLADLIEWLDRVYLAYRDTTLPSCWLWHPDVIEELWWLRRTHAEAFHPQQGTWQRVGDWHDRQRPGVIKRVRSAVRGCELALHAAGGERHHPAPLAPLAEAAEQLAGWAAGGRAGTAPEPTPAQLVEAARYDSIQYGNHS